MINKDYFSVKKDEATLTVMRVVYTTGEQRITILADDEADPADPQTVRMSLDMDEAVAFAEKIYDLTKNKN